MPHRTHAPSPAWGSHTPPPVEELVVAVPPAEAVEVLPPAVAVLPPAVAVLPPAVAVLPTLAVAVPPPVDDAPPEPVGPELVVGDPPLPTLEPP